MTMMKMMSAKRDKKGGKNEDDEDEKIKRNLTWGEKMLGRIKR